MVKMIGDIFTGFMIVAGIAIVIGGAVLGNIPMIVVGALIAIISGVGLWMALK